MNGSAFGRQTFQVWAVRWAVVRDRIASARWGANFIGKVNRVIIDLGDYLKRDVGGATASRRKEPEGRAGAFLEWLEKEFEFIPRPAGSVVLWVVARLRGWLDAFAAGSAHFLRAGMRAVCVHAPACALSCSPQHHQHSSTTMRTIIIHSSALRHVKKDPRSRAR